MFRTLACAAAALVLALPTLGRETPVAPPPNPVLDQDDCPVGTFRGRVVVVTGETITVKPEGFVASRSIENRGRPNQRVISIYKQDNTKPPSTLVFSDTLLDINGTLPANRRVLPLAGVGKWERQHKLSVVRIGDHVEIETDVDVNKVPVCRSLEILRRYGGQVPAAIGDDLVPKRSAHLRVDVSRNAEQAREEKAFALAARLLRTVAR